MQRKPVSKFGGMLEQRDNPAAAAKIYHFLARHCADSPLAEYIREGLAETEHRPAAPAR
jgi:hypothetical protein